jgi:hypothetical protein
LRHEWALFGLRLRLSGFGEAGFILQIVHNSRYPLGSGCEIAAAKAFNSEVTEDHGVNLIRLAFYVFGEHFFGVDGYEDSLAAGQDFTVFVEDFGGVYVGAALYFDLAAFYAEGFV